MKSQTEAVLIIAEVLSGATSLAQPTPSSVLTCHTGHGRLEMCGLTGCLAVGVAGQGYAVSAALRSTSSMWQISTAKSAWKPLACSAQISPNTKVSSMPMQLARRCQYQ